MSKKTIASSLTLSLIFLGKPELKKGMQYSWQPGPKLVVTWEKEQEDFISYFILVKLNTSPFTLYDSQQTDQTTVEFIGLPDSVILQLVLRVTDAASQTSDPVTAIVQGNYP